MHKLDLNVAPCRDEDRNEVFVVLAWLLLPTTVLDNVSSVAGQYENSYNRFDLEATHQSSMWIAWSHSRHHEICQNEG